jgi:hypothetical protein
MPEQVGEWDENDPRFGIRLLSLRVEQLVKEKAEDELKLSELTKRVASMEKTFQRGAGALIVMPIIGTIVGLLFAYGSVIFKPWLSK